MDRGALRPPDWGPVLRRRQAPVLKPPGRARRRAAPGPRAIYRALRRAYGPQGWWPARTRFEVIVGAILTQGVAWRNVERAIEALRRARLLSPDRLRRAPHRRVAALIRPARYFNQKARTLGAFLRHLGDRHGDDLGGCLRQPAGRLRADLLAIRGIGPETADAIALYAAGRPAMVVDAYTVRIFRRHGLLSGREPYDQARRTSSAGLQHTAPVLNEFHALLVRVGKDRCRRGRPRCEGCPLERLLPPGGPLPDRSALSAKPAWSRHPKGRAGRGAPGN